MDAAAALLPLAVALGALTQRVTGIGFALVASPLLVLATGPFTGVALSNLLGVAVASVVLLSSLRQVDWGTGLLLLAPALAAIVPGALLARTLPAAFLEVLVGALVLAALAVAGLAPRQVPRRGGVALAAGAVSGFMNVTAGVGGPAVAAYAMATSWEQRRFAATFQAYTLVVNAVSLTAKGGVTVPASTLLLAGAGLAVGLTAGHALAGRVTGSTARRWVVTVAAAGACATLLRGLTGLLA